MREPVFEDGSNIVLLHRWQSFGATPALQPAVTITNEEFQLTLSNLDSYRRRQVIAWLLEELQAIGTEKQTMHNTTQKCVLSREQVSATCQLLQQLGSSLAVLKFARWIVMETEWKPAELFDVLLLEAWEPNANLLRCMPVMLMEVCIIVYQIP